jgi:hypothetical protein
VRALDSKHVGVLECLFEADKSKVIEDKVSRVAAIAFAAAAAVAAPAPALAALLRLSLAGCLLLPHWPFLLDSA